MTILLTVIQVIGGLIGLAVLAIIGFALLVSSSDENPFQ